MSTLEFKLPDIGEGLGEAEILRWHVSVGEQVAEDQIIVEVETDKSAVGVPAPCDGIVQRLGGEVGDVLAVGSILAVLEVPGGGTDTAPANRRRVLASPATRAYATELGVDMGKILGTGPSGRVTREDVEQASRPIPAPASGGIEHVERPLSPGGDQVFPLRGLRRQIAKTMTQSWQQIPHITELREIEATELVRVQRMLRAELEPEGIRLTYLPIFIRATVAALQEHPSMNAQFDSENEQIVYRGQYNIGFATATDDGLIVPVLHDADQLSLLEMTKQIHGLVESARSRKSSPEQLSHGTFTITNYGTFGTWMGTPIIRPPEVAIAGFGRIREAVIPVRGKPRVRQVLPIAVSADHRLNDGDRLGAFVNTLSAYLQEPALLLARTR